MNIIESYCTGNTCYKTNRKYTVKGLMLHSVGTPQPSAKVFVGIFNKKTDGVCVHAFLEASGDVYQTLPWDTRAGHCGSGPRGSANNTHLSVEMTEPNSIVYISGGRWVDNDPKKTLDFVKKTYKAAVDLFAFLCEQYKLDPLQDGVIISHSEGHRRGIASNHADVEHIWSRFGMTMDNFRKEVKQKMAENKNDIAGHWAEKNIEQVMELGIMSGYPGGNFMPDKAATRAEVATAILRAYALSFKAKDGL